MKNIFAIGIIPVLMLLAFVNNTKEIVVDNSKIIESTIEWKAYKVTGSHFGNVDMKSGNLKFDDEGTLVGGEITIDMNSMTTNDLSGTYATKLMNHLKSDDFFSVADFPIASLKITDVVVKEELGTYALTADMTIKGKMNAIKFEAKVFEENGKKVAKAELKINRANYDVKYGSKSFFKDIGDKMIYDEFDLNVKFVVE